MKILPSGDDALLVELDDLDAVTALYTALNSHPLGQVVDLVPAAQTLLVVAEPGSDLTALAAAIRRTTAQSSQPTSCPGPPIEIPMRYDGPDLETAAQALDCSRAQFQHRHQEEIWRVAFTGFAPGFGYLVGTRFAWDLPRRRDPRPRVPAGSVALAGGYAGVYPQDSPGGWLLIGSTEVPMFDLDRDPPVLLTPGSQVQFTLAPANAETPP